MNIKNTHVLLVDYRPNVLQDLSDKFSEHSAFVHTALNRTDALGKLWALASDRIIPRAIISSWLLDDPEGRRFYKLIGREIDHTSLYLFKQAAKLDEIYPEHNTIMLCYAEDTAEAAFELSLSGLSDKVGIADAADGLDKLVGLLATDDRNQILTKLKRQVTAGCLYDEEKSCSRCDSCRRLSSEGNPTCLQVLVEETDPAAPEEAGASGSTMRRRVRALSR